MENKKIIFLIIIISGFFSFIMTYNIYINDKTIIESFEKDILKIRLYNLYINKFDYLHGLYLIPNGIFIVFILIYLDLPDFKTIYKTIKKDLKNKIKKDLEEFKKRGQ